MTAEELIKVLDAANIQIGFVGGELKALDPDGNLTAEMLASLRKHKSWLVESLKPPSTLTPSDFPNAATSLDQAFLDQLQTSMPMLERLYTATPMQRGLIFHSMFDDAGAAYVGQMYGELVGPIDQHAFQQSWNAIINRHDIFRTAFVGFDQDVIHQAVVRQADFKIRVEDWRQHSIGVSLDDALKAFRLADKARGFDFDSPPLMRFTLLRVEDERYYFVWSHHHVLTDGWCLGIIFNELFTLYASILRGEEMHLRPATKFETFVSWLRKQDEDAALQFWKTYLNGFDQATPLLIGRTASQAADNSRCQVGRQLSEELSNSLFVLARGSKCTVNSVVQAAWAYLLHRYSGESDVVFGATVSGRPPEIDGIETMVGLFINTIPVRVRFAPDLSIKTLLATLHQDQAVRDENAFVALSDIQRVASASRRQTLFESIVVFENYPRIPSLTLFEIESGDVLRADQVTTDEQSNYPLSLMISGHDQLQIAIRYDSTQYDDVSMQDLASHLEIVLRGFAASDPHLPVHSISFMSEAEEQRLLTDWSRTGSRDLDPRYLHQMFEYRALQSPTATAITQGEFRIDYQTLNEKANRLAHYLVSNGVGPETIVGICVNRSIEMIIVILGVLKAGGAYVPLDAKDSDKRLKSMMADCSLALCVVDGEALNRLPLDSLDFVLVEGAASDAGWLADYDISNLDPNVRGLQKNHLAYVIFTSGSTGAPKGVMVEHRNFLHYVIQAADRYLTDDITGSVVSSALAFDATITAIFPPLVTGRSLHLTKADDADLESLATIFRSTPSPLLFKLTPSHLDAVAAYHLPGPISALKHHLVIGGEQWWSSSALEWAKLLPNATFSNEYGPTEAVVGCCVYEFAASDAFATLTGLEAVPIGRPIDDTQLYVLSDDYKPVPVGCRGELYIGGRGVTRGYIGQQALTLERFIADPFKPSDDERLYKTGDVVLYLQNGQLVFVSRNDGQLKIRGHRVELVEVEAALRSIPGVREGVVVAQKINRQHKLFAFVTGELSGHNSDSLRMALSQMLPSHMLPATVTVLDAIPLTSNGKVDRRNLELSFCEPQVQHHAEPQNEIEVLLCNIWQSVLGLPKVGIHDNFFEIGGDSILSIQISARAKARGLPVTVKHLFEQQTIAAIAKTVARSPTVLSHNELSEGSQIIMPIQRQYLSEQNGDVHHFNQAIMLESPVGFDKRTLQTLVDLLHSRHDVFRLRFYLNGDGWTASYADLADTTADSAVCYFDLSTFTPNEKAASLGELCEELQRSLHLQNGPIMRAAFFDFGPQERGRVLFVIHHLAVDGVSWRVMIDEINLALEQINEGLKPDLGIRPPTYKVWAEHAYEFASSSSLREETPFWLSQTEVGSRQLSFESSDEQSCELAIESFELLQEETEFLLGPAHDAYRSRGHELLLAALYRTLCILYNEDHVLLFIEGHGRDLAEGDFDTSQTIGWFTCLYPLAMKFGKPSDLASVIKATKEGCRSVPRGGIGYGLLTELAGDTRLVDIDREARKTSLRFNYLGQIDGTSADTIGFKLASEAVGSTRSNSLQSLEPAAVNVVVRNRQMAFYLSCDNGRIRQSQLAQMASAYRQNIGEIIEHCRAELALQALALAGREILDHDNSANREDEFEI